MLNDAEKLSFLQQQIAISKRQKSKTIYNTDMNSQQSNNVKQNVLRICISFILILVFAVLSYCLCAAFLSSANMEYTMDEATFFTADSPIRNLIFLILLIGILFLLDKVCTKLKPVILFWISAIILAGLFLYLIQDVNLTPTWDALRTFQAAEQFIDGNYDSLLPGGYIAHYPFQIPMMLYNCLLILVFGDTYIASQWINVLYFVGCYYCLFRLTAIYSHDNARAQRICILLSAAFLPLGMYTMFIYSNMPALFFMLAGILQGSKYLQTSSIRHLVCAYSLLCISSLFKGTSYIAIIALTIAVIFKMIQEFHLKTVLITVLSVFILINVPQAISLSVEKLDPRFNFEDSLYVEYALEMGCKRSLRGAGWHDGWMETYLDEYSDSYEEKEYEARRIIHDNYAKLFSSADNAVAFYRDKLNSMWTSPDFQGYWTIQANKNDTRGLGDSARQSYGWIEYDTANDSYSNFTESYMNGSLNRVIRGFLNAEQNLVYLFSLIFLLSQFRRKEFTADRLLLPLTFLGGFLFLAIWEAKAQYSILFYVLLFPCAAIGLDYFYHFIEQTLGKRWLKRHTDS